jgi:phage terminase large subunit-like protein
MPAASTLARWHACPASFVEECLISETGKPFELLSAEREFLKHALTTGPDGRLLYPELVYSCPKKSGKTTFAALLLLTIVLLYGGKHAEGYIASNDYEQSVGRVFEACRRIVEASPLLREAKITADRIVFPSTNATIVALTSSAASAAGCAPTIAVFDELWGFTTERSRRLFDELVPVPTRKVSCRLTVSYAGYSGESALLESLYNRGMQQPEVGPDLRAGDGMLCYWSHLPVAFWQTPEWVEQMRRSLRPQQFERMICNRWVASAEASFVDVARWDACTTAAGPAPADKALPVYVGVDASAKLDATAIVAVTYDRVAKRCRLVAHRLFVPTAGEAIDFASVEEALLDLHRRFAVRVISYDPWAFVSSAQRLRMRGLPMRETAQTPANLTSASAALHELIVSGHLVAYPDRDMRAAIASATTVEGPRGMRIAKMTRNARIDLAVALALAVHAALDDQARPRGWLEVSGWESDAEEEKPSGQSRADPQAVQSWCEAIRAYG